MAGNNFIFILKPVFYIYRMIVSPFFTVVFDIRCRYEESCSHYTERKISELGFFSGVYAGSKRILSCNPWIKPKQK